LVSIKDIPSLLSKQMSLNYYKTETEKICKKKGWDRAAVDTVWLLLTEEFGELASAIRQYKKTFKKTNLKKERGTDVMMEMGDVFSYLFQLAHMLNVDLDQMWKVHQTKMIDKKYYLT
tara:strand:+ start:290 stop:643 length:354 start_codon:yes stop_codon:yes gene_type:complete